MKDIMLRLYIRRFFLLLIVVYTTLFSIEQKKSIKILMVVASFPKIHDICMLNQMTGLIDRGHDVHIYALHQGDFSQVQQDVITYDLVNKTIFEKLPDSLDSYDIILFQLGHKL